MYMCTDQDGTVVLMEWVPTSFILFRCRYVILCCRVQETLGEHSYLTRFLHLFLLSTDTLDQIEVSKELFGKNCLYIQGVLNFTLDHYSFTVKIKNL